MHRKNLFLSLLVGLLLPVHVVLAESLMQAAKRGDLSAVTTKIESGVSANQLDADDWRETPPLLAATKNHHIDVVTYLIKHGADCQALDFAEKNALVHAAQAGVTEIIGSLIDCGAALEITGGDGTNRTPLVWAVISGHEMTAIELVKHGANKGVTWIHPIKETSHELIETVVEKGMMDLHKLFK
jgi:ankyrin repeat protein